MKKALEKTNAIRKRYVAMCQILWMRRIAGALAAVFLLGLFTPTVLAQEAERQFEGEYLNQAEHHQGWFFLHHTGPTVVAVFSTVRSPVQYYARTEPTVLFLLPEEFRPVATVIWEVDGYVVRTDGQAISDSDSPRIFRLQVGSDGKVSYVDDAGVDGIGYLSYTANLAWPAKGAEPQVCARSLELQQAFLSALAATDCAALTWNQIGSIRSLEPLLEVSDLLDLAGLTGLESVSLRLKEGANTAFALALLPRLRDLNLTLDTREPLPNGFLSSDTGLTQLALTIPHLQTLPERFLSHVPQLIQLRLDATHLRALPPHFLIHSPRLTGISLNTPQLRTLSNDAWALLKTHAAEVVVPVGTNLHSSPSSQTETILRSAGPSRRAKVLGRQEAEGGGNWMEVAFTSGEDSYDGYFNADNNTFWIEDSSISPAGVPNATTSPQVEGEFLNQAINEEAWYRLYQTGATVIATVQVNSSPVQYLARTRPAILFTIPEGFRPAEEVIWEVEGWPVQAGELANSEIQQPHLFRLRVEPGGAVSYVNDVGVDGVGFLRYRTSLAWPVNGAEPDVCFRNWWVQEAILGALLMADCTAVSWAQLESIRKMESRLPADQAGDLAGLINLESVKLHLGAGVGLSEILAQMPRLQNLILEVDYLGTLPADFLASVPQLKSLTLYPRRKMTLPADFLAPTPQLEELTLGRPMWSSGIESLPENFLTHVPQLIRLHYSGWLPFRLLKATPMLQELRLSRQLHILPEDLQWVPQLTELDVWTSDQQLPSDFLIPVPQLTKLRLINGSQTSVPFDFLVPVPRLKALELRLGQKATLPTHFLAAVPQLHTLELMLGWYRGATDSHGPTIAHEEAEPFPDDLLTIVPELVSVKLWEYGNRDNSSIHPPRSLSLSVQNYPQTRSSSGFQEEDKHLTLQDNQLLTLPDIFFQQSSLLTHLTLQTSQLDSLPADLLALTPNLNHLTLQTDTLTPLPHTFLSPIPSLSHLNLATEQSTAWPGGFLLLPPGITHLRVQADSGMSIDKGFLPVSPWITHLVVQADNLATLPHGFLDAVPGLTNLSLYMEELTKIPEDFLTSVPNLTHLTLQANNLEELPHDLLLPTPNLTHLSLHSNGLVTLSDNFLTSTPGLTDLILQVDGLRRLPDMLLDPLPRLFHFFLQADGLEALPEDFLYQFSDLTFLTLQADNLTRLPEHFLHQTPALTYLVLKADQLTELPEALLALIDRLDHFSLQASALPSRPPKG